MLLVQEGQTATRSQERLELGDGAATTIHVTRYRRDRVAARVIVLATATHLIDWCEENDVQEAVSGAFFWRPTNRCLGEVWVNGERQATEPFREPWDKIRGTLNICADGILTLGRRDEFLDPPNGDLLQAGPLLVRHGRSLVDDGQDLEGFSAAAGQFDSDITQGRYPRSAIGCNTDYLWSVAADGRSDDEAGLALGELANYMLSLGATDALNLDGGGSATLISGGQMRNVSRNDTSSVNPRGRPIHSAIIFSDTPT